MWSTIIIFAILVALCGIITIGIVQVFKKAIKEFIDKL